MILGLDLATVTGACIGDGSGLPVLTHIRLPSPDDGARGPTFLTFVSFLKGLISDHGVTMVVFEAPIIPPPIIKYEPGRKPRAVLLTNLSTTTLLQGLAAMVEMVCEQTDTPCREVNVREVKKELGGSAQAKKGDMMAAARKVGLSPKTPDEADAFGAWLIGVRHYARQHQMQWDRRLYSARGALL